MEPRKRKYWKVHLSRAWDGTKGELRKHSLIEIVIAVGVITRIIVDIFVLEVTLNETFIHFYEVIGSLFVAFGFLFLIKSLSTHKRIYEENQETISSFREANESSEKQQEQLKIYFGIYWDKELNPYCPACKTPLTLISDSRPMCYKCDKIIGITDSEKRMGLAEARKIISSSYQTIESLEEQQRPKVEVTFQQGVLPWFQEQPSTSASGQDYIYRIELMNLGSETIHNPRVRLVKINPHPRPSFNVPCDLQLNCKDIQKTENQGEGEFVDVFKYLRPSKDGHEMLWIQDIHQAKSKIPVQEYEIKIIVSSDSGGDSITKHFRFNPKPKNPKFCMEMID